MNIDSLVQSKLGRLIITATAVFVIGLLNPPALVSEAQAAVVVPVAVDQQPLTVRPQIPPDITLMLDDSGSMAWDVMPDYPYLGATQGSPTADELTSADINGVYFDPTVNYATPFKADGSLYPAATFTSAWIDGFNQGTGTVDLSTYDGSSDSSTSTSGCCSSTSAIAYTQAFTVTVAGTPYPPANCPSGYALVGAQCQKQDYFASCPFGSTMQTSGTNLGKCKTGSGSHATYAYACGGTDTFVQLVGTKDECRPNPPVYSIPSCNAGDSINASGLCVPPGTTRTLSFFTYTVQNGSTYTRYYVGLTGTCALVSAIAANCDETSTTQQNVANWFSYYHTRILMAKSGLMNAFATLDPKFRVGFGSINDNNANGLPSPVYNSYNSYTSNNQTTNFSIAGVAPFGRTTDAASQRINFWNWVAGESPGNSTPLRMALDSVGQYYSDSNANAWDTMASDPVPAGTSALACRQAYTILTTDGFWNERWSSGPGNVDGNSGAAITGPNNQSYAGYTAAAPYSDSNSNTLADVAMKYWNADLQTGIPNEVPTSSADPAFWQHMTTFTLGLGFAPTGIKPDGTTIDQVFNWANNVNGQAAISNFSWPTPARDSINNIADLAHAGLNGHGGFFSATSPQAFANGLLSALKRATERVGTGASLAANSTQLQTGTAVFQANYYSGVWKGDLKELLVDPNTGKIATTSSWSAGQVLQSSATSTTVAGTTTRTFPNRVIKTYNTSTKAFVDFKNSGTTPPTLSAAQLSKLGSTATEQVNLVNFLRGDETNDQQHGGNYRTREWALGDIVNSQPVYVGAPTAAEFVGKSFVGYSSDPNNPTNTSATPFQDWAVGTSDASGNFTASAASRRTPLVYVTANDGMLHAFNASTGAETFAYLPGSLLVNDSNPDTSSSLPLSRPLKSLSDPGYGGDTVPHTYFNDGELTVADVYVALSGDPSGGAWHSILVGTTGRGPARAVYALDVTDPSNITPLWERYANDGSTLDSNSVYIGQMVGKPVIAQTGDYGSTAGPPWSVLIGNGYNSVNGVAALLQFDLVTGKLYTHAAGSATSNGLAAPVAWMDTPSSGMNDIAYAGDLLGNMWSFPLINVRTTGSGTTYTPTPSASGNNLFTTSDGTKAQPITGGTIAGLNPTTHAVWVFFGTGKYLTQTDTTNTDKQSWYALIVQNSPGGGDVTTSGLTNLVQRSIIAQQDTTASALGVRAVTAKPSSSDMSGKNGWYMNFLKPATPTPTAEGERMVVPNILQGNLLVGTTRIPASAATNDPCNPAGTGWIMAVDPFTGTNPTTGFFDTNADGNINSSDMITLSNGQKVPAAGVGFSSLPNAPIFVGVDMLVSFDNGSTSSLKTAASSGGTGRVSWQEIVIP